MDQMTIYDIVYALAAQDGREAALFGDCAPAAREAFSRCLTCDTFPELWFEMPLTGKPWLDFHALVSYEDVAGTQAVFAGHSGVYSDALAWFAAQKPKKVRQLALSYDTSSDDTEHPAVQVLVSGRDAAVPVGFLRSAGRSDAETPYLEFVHAMPQDWFACYVGVFPRRTAGEADSWIRVECIVGDACQHAYAKDSAILRDHLKNIGLEHIGSDAIAGIQELARSPFPLELQFNIGPNGAALPIVSASVRFQPGDWMDPAGQDAISKIARWMQVQELADARCILLAKTMFAKLVTHEDENVSLSCFPAFVKLRYREDQAPDAKAYLLARAE